MDYIKNDDFLLILNLESDEFLLNDDLPDDTKVLLTYDNMLMHDGLLGASDLGWGSYAEQLLN